MTSPSNGIAGESTSAAGASSDDYCSTAILMQRHHQQPQNSVIPDVLASCAGGEHSVGSFDSTTTTGHGSDDQQTDDRRGCNFLHTGCAKSKFQPRSSKPGIQSSIHRLQTPSQHHHQYPPEQLNPYLAAVQQAFNTSIANNNNNNNVVIGDATVDGLCQSSNLNDGSVEDETKHPGSVASILGSSSGDAANCAVNVTTAAGLYHPGTFEWHLPYAAAAASQFYSTAANAGGRPGCFPKFEDSSTSSYYRSTTPVFRPSSTSAAVSRLSLDNCGKNNVACPDDERMSAVDDDHNASPSATTMSSSSSSNTSPSFAFDGANSATGSGYPYQQFPKHHHQQLYSSVGSQNQHYQSDLGSTAGSCAFSSSGGWMPWHQVSHVQPALTTDASRVSDDSGLDKNDGVGSTQSHRHEAESLQSNVTSPGQGPMRLDSDIASSPSTAGDTETKSNLKTPMSSAEIGILDIPALPPADELKFYPKRFTNQARNKRKAGAASSGSVDDKSSSDSKTGDKAEASSPSASNGTTNNASQRPAYSYVMMIAMAIRSSPQKRLPLRKIYEYISQNFPHFKPDVGGWKNSVRHNLSLNDCFVKQPRQPGEGKGHNWVIKPGCEEDFENCENDAEGFKKRRRRRHAKKASKNFYSKNFTTPAPAYMARLPRNTMPSVLPSHCLSSPWNPDYSAVYQTRMAHQAAAAAAGSWKYLEPLADQYSQQHSHKLSQSSFDAVGRNAMSPSIGSAAVSPPSTAAAAAAAAAAVVAAEASHQQTIAGFTSGQLASQNAFSSAFPSYSNALFANSNQDLSSASRLSATQNLFLGQFPQAAAAAAVAHCQIGASSSSLESPAAAAFSAAAAAAHSHQFGEYSWASS